MAVRSAPNLTTLPADPARSSCPAHVVYVIERLCVCVCRTILNAPIAGSYRYYPRTRDYRPGDVAKVTARSVHTLDCDPGGQHLRCVLFETAACIWRRLVFIIHILCEHVSMCMLQAVRHHLKR